MIPSCRLACLLAALEAVAFDNYLGLAKSQNEVQAQGDHAVGLSPRRNVSI